MTSPKGRPPVDPSNRPAASVYTHITLPTALYDKAYADARRHRMTLPEWIRYTLRRAPSPPDPDISR
jgi:hypothetical protein